MRWGHEQLRGLAPVGRLDIDSVVLLVLTQDGRVVRQVIGEDSEIERAIAGPTRSVDAKRENIPCCGIV